MFARKCCSPLKKHTTPFPCNHISIVLLSLKCLCPQHCTNRGQKLHSFVEISTFSYLSFFSFLQRLCENLTETPSGLILISLRGSRSQKKVFFFSKSIKLLFKKQKKSKTKLFNGSLRLLRKRDNSSFILARLLRSRAVWEQTLGECWQPSECLFYGCVPLPRQSFCVSARHDK